ncbi:MAG: hypothetical protein Q9219_004393 [cf. Caloplaca sp. 3 TL-2023]
MTQSTGTNESRTPAGDGISPKSSNPFQIQSLKLTLPSVTLYTNHSCPWAHRAHITLRALKLPYEEVIIDLNRPRDPWYLDINPRGLVPSIKISNGILKDEIITESAITSTFLADAYPSPTFWPASHSTPTSALERARMTFFVDTFINKINGLAHTVLKAEGEEQEKLGQELLNGLKTHIEPLLEGAGPFFGGSSTLTLVEALTASFVIRYYTYAQEGLFPKSILKGLDAMPNYSRWSKAIHERDEVMYIYNRPNIVASALKRIQSLKSTT